MTSHSNTFTKLPHEIPTDVGQIAYFVKEREDILQIKKTTAKSINAAIR
jgi:hypothetical protein